MSEEYSSDSPLEDEEGEDALSEDEPSDDWEDVLGSGAVLKRTLRPGRSKICPEYKQEVFVHVVGVVASNGQAFLDTYAAGKPLQFEIGDMVLGIVDHGVMLAARMMHEGEICSVKVISRYAFGEKGLPPLVPPNADLEYRLEMVRIGEFTKDASEMSDLELVNAVRLRKDRGNHFYNLEEHEKALRCYQQGLKLSDRQNLVQTPEDANKERPPADDEDHIAGVYDEELNELRVQITNNSATVYEKMEKYKEALDACVALLQYDPSHLKALLRVARISTAKGDFKEAALALTRASEYYPDDTSVRRQIKLLKKRKEEYNLKKKKIFGGVLKTAPVTKEATKPTLLPRLDSKPVDPNSVLENSKSKKSFLRRMFALMTLLAPTIVFIVVLSFFPKMATGEEISQSSRPWARVENDLAQVGFNKIQYQTLQCGGQVERASCCACRSVLLQVELRVDRHNDKAAPRLSYRRTQTTSRPSFKRNEMRLLTELDNACDRVPLDIPKNETRIDMVKNQFKRSCNTMIDEFHDDIFYHLLRNEESMVDFLCSDVIGSCDPVVPWTQALSVLSTDSVDYTTLPCSSHGQEPSQCCLCKAISKSVQKLLHTGSELNELLASPQLVCSTVSLGIPIAETRLVLVKQNVGASCMQFLRRYRDEIIRSSGVEELCPLAASCRFPN